METLLTAKHSNEPYRMAQTIKVPAQTVWPFILAFGVALLFAGLVTSSSVSVLGCALALAGSVGWFRQVLPHEREETMPIVSEAVSLRSERREVERLAIYPERQRAWLPVHSYPVSAGLKGGLAGSVAMAALACLYGVLKVHSIWYPINLLSAAVYAQSLQLGPNQLNAFHAGTFAIACGLHLLVSALVGLLYGAMLPMFPRRPIFLGGLVAPALWSGLLYTILGLVNPLLASHIDWLWFIASQVAFGIVAGLVVMRQSSVPTYENVAFALRAGIEAPGIMPPHQRGEQRS